MKNATMNDSHLLDDVLAFDNMGRTVYGAEYLDRLASAFATLDIDATKWCTHYIMVHCKYTNTNTAFATPSGTVLMLQC